MRRSRPGDDTAGPGWLGRALGRIARTAHQQRAASIALVVALTLLGFAAARSLRLDTDLSKLLPRSFESVRSLDVLQSRSFGVGYVAVVARGAPVEVLQRFADDIAPQLEALPSISYVDYKRPDAFFREQSLYFIDVEDLEEIHERIEARREWEARTNMPLYDLGLDELPEEPPSLEFDDLRAKYERKLGRGAGDGSRRSDYLVDEAGTAVVLLAKPMVLSSDVGQSDQVVHDVQRLVDGIDRSSYDAALTVDLSGRYKKKVDQKQQIERDLKLGSSLALLLMVGYLMFHFRRLSGALLVLAPLTAGVVWTFGATAVVFGKLNLLTGFIGAILLGLGVDHGIHLLSRFDEEYARTGSVSESIDAAFSSTGRAVVVAALTTALGFIGVSVSEFRAFREFGVIAGLGSVFIVLAFHLLLPALLSVGQRRQPASALRRKPSSVVARSLPRWAPPIAWLSLLVFLGASLGLGANRFDYDFASLEDSRLPSFQLDKEINRLLGRSQTPLVALADEPSQEREVAAALRAQSASLGTRSAIQQIVALDDFVPGRQAEKRAQMVQIEASLRSFKPTRLSAERQRQRTELLDLLDARPFGRADLPAALTRQFGAKDGQPAFVLVFPSVSLSDGDGVRRLSSELRGARLAGGVPIVIAGEAMVLADVLEMVERESPKVLALTLLLVAVVIAIALGRRSLLPCVGASAATVLVTAGLMPHVDLRFNYLNIVMVPVLFGVSVDGAVHLVTRLKEGQDIAAATNDTGRAIAGAILTTGVGFGALLVADHPGLRSLATLALLGLAVNLVVCLVALPAFLAMRSVSGVAATGGRPRWVTAAATVGYAGLSPLAPGTVGSLAAVPIGILLARMSTVTHVAALLVISVGALWVTRLYLRHTTTGDPQEVVVDELAGCLVAMAFVPAEPVWVVAAVVAFRLLDIFKPGPIRRIDRMHGAVGVVGDDLAAGLVAGVGLWLVRALVLAEGLP